MDAAHQLLPGKKLQLELIGPAHHQELYTIAQDPTIWTYNGSKGFGDSFQAWFAHALTDIHMGNALAFAVRRLSDQQLVGSTRCWDINGKHKRLTIGYTWYVPEVWGTFVNPECKFLLLQLAFETLGFNRVELHTDVRNARSRAAIKKLGASEEGILRKHMVLPDGKLRDTIIFSILNDEWPQVKSKLLNRIEQS